MLTYSETNKLRKKMTFITLQQKWVNILETSVPASIGWKQSISISFHRQSARLPMTATRVLSVTVPTKLSHGWRDDDWTTALLASWASRWRRLTTQLHLLKQSLPALFTQPTTAHSLIKKCPIKQSLKKTKQCQISVVQYASKKELPYDFCANCDFFFAFLNMFGVNVRN